MNIILNTDSYKLSHFKQYPPNTTEIWSYIEARKQSGIFKNTKDVEVVNFGLQSFIKKYLLTPITIGDINSAEVLATMHGLPFNHNGWKTIITKYGGFLPLEIEGLDEGLPIDISNAQVQVRNTDPEFFWLVSYIETAMLRSIWYPSTVATLSREIKKVIYKYLKETSENPDEQIQFKLHDFGARGVSSEESAEIGGAAHLINFKGTDTLSAIGFIDKYYSNIYSRKGWPYGYSIPAAEHSTITTWGKENEKAAYSNMIDQFGAGALYAVVSDSYDIYNAVDNIWGKELKEKVLKNNATLVVRPDSGDINAVNLYLMESLAKNFGYETNNLGYKVLNPKVRVIQGDGVNLESIRDLLIALKYHKWSTENIAFGMGGGLLQQVNRDTLSYAMKSNAAVVDGKMIDVYKQPVTDQNKYSKRGVLSVFKTNDGFFTVRKNNCEYPNLLKTRYRNGILYNETNFTDIRNNATVI